MFNSTVGPFTSESAWTTVLMTEPSGIINNWSYVRHTSVTGSPYSVTTEPGFISCLAKCQSNPTCVAVSYSFHDTRCAMFNSTKNTERVELNYGFVSAFNIRQIPYGKDVFWRFNEVDRMFQAANQSEGRDKIQNKLGKQMNDCLNDDRCYGIGFEKSRQVYERIRIDAILTGSYNVTSMLLYPKLNSGLHKYLDQYEFLPNIQMSNILDLKTKLKVNSLEECLEQLKSNTQYTKASYSFNLNVCHLGDTKVTFQENKQEKYITILPKPGLQSNLKNFAKLPGIGINTTAQAYHECQANCEDECASKCKQHCSHVLIKYQTNRTECYFYKENETFIASASHNSFTLVKHSNFDFSLESLNKLSPLQNRHFYGCFAQVNNQTNNTALIGKRDFFGFVSESVTAVGSFVVETVKSVTVDVVVGKVKMVAQTAEGIVGTVKHAIKGDWEGAKNAFLEIPIVKDVKNVVELGIAVCTLDFEKMKDKFLEVLDSESFDLILTVIPWGGFASIGAKLSLKALTGIVKLVKKGAAEKVKRGIMLLLDKVNKNKLVEKGKEELKDILKDEMDETIHNLIDGMNITGRMFLKPLYVKTFSKRLLRGSSKIRKSSTTKMEQISPNEKFYFFFGTRDIEKGNFSTLDPIEYIRGKYNKQGSCFILVPNRWDKPYLNDAIHKFNEKLKNILQNHKVPYLDPNEFLRTEHYARDGLQLNIRGKRLLSLKLMDMQNHKVIMKDGVNLKTTPSLQSQQEINNAKWIRIMI